MRRILLLLPLAWLAACGVVPPAPFVVLAVIDAAAVPVLGRDVSDAMISGLTGRDCSKVRLDQRKSYCRPVDPPPERPVFCTRSLGRADCWSNPDALSGRQHEIADGPRSLTPEQEAYRTRKWPWW